MSHGHTDAAGSRLSGSNLHGTPGLSDHATHRPDHPKGVFYQSKRKQCSEMVVIDVLFPWSFRAIKR